MGNKISVIIGVAFQLLLVACNSNNTYTLTPKSLYIKDSKPCTDSLYEVWGRSYNGREIEFQFVVNNNTDEKLYLPLSAWNRKNTDSISVCFINGTEKIVPYFSVKKVPFDSDFINANDSMRIFVKLYGFPEWQKDWCNVNLEIEDIISKLRITYYSGSTCSKEVIKKLLSNLMKLLQNM